MKLSEWIEKTGNVVKDLNGCKVIADDFPVSADIREKSNREDLWRLSDYVVSSVTGGSIYLVSRPEVKYYSPKSVAQELASLCQARHNCVKAGNSDWFTNHTDLILAIVKNYLPSGSGIDNGTKIDLEKSNGEKLVFNTAFHHMDEHGYYDGWSEHVVTVKASFQGIDLKISGRNRNDIKEYLHETYALALQATCKAIREDTRVYEWVIADHFNKPIEAHEGMNKLQNEISEKRALATVEKSM